MSIFSPNDELMSLIVSPVDKYREVFQLRHLYLVQHLYLIFKFYDSARLLIDINKFNLELLLVSDEVVLAPGLVNLLCFIRLACLDRQVLVFNYLVAYVSLTHDIIKGVLLAHFSW